MDFQGVIKILDEAIGGPGVGIGAHRAFWRDISRDEFVAKEVFGKALVVLGDAANSNLVHALKGEFPFGSDLPNPPQGATTRRMPAGRPPVPAQSIAAIEQWINDGARRKIHSLNKDVGFISLENFAQAAILKTVDGGQTWTRVKAEDPQGNANLEGIGFLDENTGWVGGWGSTDFRKGFSSATSDGGQTWKDANEIGRFINRFRFFRDISLGYASGRTVYKYSVEPIPARPGVAGAAVASQLQLLADNAPTASALPLEISVNVPERAGRLIVCIWDRFAKHVRRLIDETQPQSGVHALQSDGTDDDGWPVRTGEFPDPCHRRRPF
jgi:hypothetical protein